jgi:endonuclease YncB( thermonuclease family)
MKTLFLFIALTTASFAATLQGDITKYSDADTLKIWNLPIRLLGIDAPEYAQTCKDGNGREYKCGIVALNRLKEIIGSSEVRCEGDETDRYKRLLATCYVGDMNINQTLVAEGHAVAFVKYDTVYLPQEQAAQKAKAGIWQGEFQRPAEYRKKGWKEAEQTAKTETGSECLIKGNINRKGDKIYHTPWGSKDYKRTKINVSKGEHWFCSEDEAIAAGWRTPNR